MEHTRFFIGEWEIQPKLNRILNSKTKAQKQLEPQLMKLLLCLVEHKPEVVSKEKLMECVWSDVIVTDNVLTRAISSLRKELGDTTRNSKYIETISKTGYRLIADVKHFSQKTLSKGEQDFARKRKLLLIVTPAFLLLLLSSFSIWKMLTPKELKVLHPSVLVNNSTIEYYPSISKDGQFAAYAEKSTEGNNWDIFVKRIGAEAKIQLTNHPNLDLRPIWSPDGTHVYFTRHEDTGPVIYKVPMIGGKEARVLTAGKYSWGDFDIAPNNNQLVFNDRKDNKSPQQIQLIDLTQGEKTFITNPPKGFNGDVHPIFSPDGTKIAFLREKNPISMFLFVLDLKNNNTRQITTDYLTINGFDWAADGKSIVYSSNKTGIYKLWSVNIESLKNQLLPVSDDQMVMPKIAENGQIIYSKIQDEVNIWSYSLSSKTASTWRSTKKLDLNPSPSPDGSKVAFVTNRTESYQLWTSDKDGNNPVMITNFKGQYINTPRWSNDSKYIIFQGSDKGQTDIYRVNSLGGIAENLTNESFDNHTPMYSLDNKSIYYSSNKSGTWQVWKMDANGGAKKQVTKNSGYAPQFSKKNPSKLYHLRNDKAGIWSFDLENQTEIQEVKMFNPKSYGAYSVSDNGIYYLNFIQRTVDFINFTTQKSTSIFTPKKISPFGITLNYSSKLQSLFYAQTDRVDADIMYLKEK